MTAVATGAQLPSPGDIVGGKYVLDRLLGQGGMGAVFAAKHRKLGHQVAIKIMLADSSNPEAAQRFINEGRAAANIQNEHVVRVDDVDEEMGYAYMVLELLDGEDLAQVLEREKRIQPQTAVHYVLQALKGVSQAHALGIVHRDLKPSNLFLARRKDGSQVVKVLDFGISKANTGALGQAPNALTSTKAMLGSPLYMSPEQLRSSKSVDQRADIWAIGVILYELLTGALPFMGDNLGELFAAILETDAVSVRQRAPEVPPDLEAVVLRCLQRRPEARFQTAAELVQALGPLGSGSYMGPAPGGLGGTAMLAPGHVPRPFGMTPNPGQQPPPGSAISGISNQGVVIGRQTGSGSGSRAGGTMAIGAMTPPGGGIPGAQTGSSWQSTGTGTIPKSKLPVAIIAGLAAVFVIGIGVVGVVVAKGKTGTPTGVTASNAPSAEATVPVPSANTAVATAVTAPVPTPSATATETVAVTPPVTKPAGGTPTHHTTPKVDPPKVDPPKVDPPKVTPPVTPPATKPTGGGSNLQNGR